MQNLANSLLNLFQSNPNPIFNRAVKFITCYHGRCTQVQHWKKLKFVHHGELSFTTCSLRFWPVYKGMHYDYKVIYNSLVRTIFV